MAETKAKVFDPVYDSIGDSGTWQTLMVLLLSVAKFPIGWHQLSTVIVAPPAKYDCADPDNITDACSDACKRVSYDRSIFEETAVTEWDLICDKEIYANMGQTIFMFGILIGNISFGIWADKRGRRFPLCFSVVMQLTSGCLAAISPWYWLFVFFRFLCAVATGGNMLTTFCVLMEIIGPSKREFFHGIVYQVPFNLGHMFLAPIAYFIRDFRWFQFTLSIFSVVMLSYIFLIPESPRWLVMAGRGEEAIAILEKAAKFNKTPTDNIRENVEEVIRRSAARPPVKKGRIFDLLRTPNLRLYSLCIFFNWFAVGFNYFGVSSYVGQLGGNMFVNIAISALFGVPGVILSVPACKYLGRKPSLFVADLIVTIGMIGFIFVPADNAFWQVVLASVAVFGAACTFPTNYLYAGEIFPTSARNSGMGMSSMLARFGAMLAAHASSFKKIYRWLPPLIFAIIGLIAALLVLLLPETLGQPLPETAEDAENYGKKKVVVESDKGMIENGFSDSQM